VAKRPNALLRQLDTYPYRLELVARFGDVDPQWHLNNARLTEYYQEGRVSFHRALKAEFNYERVKGSRTLVAHQAVDYLGEVAYPGSVKLGVGVAHLGNSSYSLALGMFQLDRCVGVSLAVLVNADSHGPAPLPPRLREILQTKLLPEAVRST
jgi:acyl-CoA thioester hydrolase